MIFAKAKLVTIQNIIRFQEANETIRNNFSRILDKQLSKEIGH
jgi:hypothetical protein